MKTPVVASDEAHRSGSSVEEIDISVAAAAAVTTDEEPAPAVCKPAMKSKFDNFQCSEWKKALPIPTI